MYSASGARLPRPSPARWCFTVTKHSSSSKPLAHWSAIALDPNDAFAFANRGLAYAERGQFELALEDFDAAFELHDSGQATVPLGNRQELQADRDAAAAAAG